MTPEKNSLSDFDKHVLMTQPGLKEHLTAVAQDPDLKSAIEKIDMDGFAKEFLNFTNQITEHNAFHMRETRLWSLKLGTGKVDSQLEQKLKDVAPQAAQNFQAAFQSLNNCADHIEKSGLSRVLEKHSDVFTSNYMFDESNPYGQATMGYFRKIGFSNPMIDEFKSSYKATGFEFIKTLGGGKFAQARAVSAKGAEARMAVLKYTHENGLNYIRGGGPPAWAVTVSTILASVGIMISAWVIVAIIVSLVALLVALCVTKVLPAAACAVLAAIGVISITVIVF